MKKVFGIIICLFMAVNVNAHNVHYPTYTEDDITYVKAPVSDAYIDGCRYEQWDIEKVDKPNDKTITIPYMITIDGKEVVIHEIKANAFSDCISLDSLIISDGVNFVRKTFVGCNELEYLYYSSMISRTQLYYNEYYDGLSCKTLETRCGVYEDDFWQTIKMSLEKLIIRDDATYIYTRMDNCTKLKTIVCYATNPPTSRAAHSPYVYICSGAIVTFKSSQWSTITLYVPRESLEKYYFDSVWGEIDNIYTIDEMENVTTSVNSIKNNNFENNIPYNLAGQRVNASYKGVVIINGKKMIQK